MKRKFRYEVYGWNDLENMMYQERKFYVDDKIDGVYFWIIVIINAIRIIRKKLEKKGVKK